MLSPLVGAAAWQISGSIPLSLSAAAGCLAGIAIHNDYDLIDNQIGYRVRYGSVLGAVWWLLWWPYAAAIPHRSILSHGPIIGTAVRAIYLAILIAIGLLLGRAAGWGLQLEYSQIVTPIFWRHLGVFAAGLVVSDTAHTILDISVSGAKKQYGRLIGRNRSRRQWR